jgi:hypothetical protein
VARVVTPLAVVAVVVVLAVGAVSQIGPASGPDRRTVDRSFAVLTAPIVAQSNATGSALNALVRNGPSLSRTAFFADLASLAAATTEADRQFDSLSPPDPRGDAAERCGSAMAGRQRAVGRVGAALGRLLGGRRGLGGGDEAVAAAALDGAGTLLVTADTSWAACRRALRRAPGSARLPASTWMSDPGAWNAPALGRLVAALVSSRTLAPVHRLAILAVSTDPPAVPATSGVAVLTPTAALRVRIVLADQGNVDEWGVRVVVTAVPAGTVRAPAPVRTDIDIGAGASVALSPPPLVVRPGTSYVLDITVTAPSGATTSTSVPLRVSVVPTTTTTTTTPTTTTTTKARATTTTHPG